MTFEEYKKKVDQEIQRRVGLSADDLPDFDYVSDWEDCVSVKRCAARAIRAAND